MSKRLLTILDLLCYIFAFIAFMVGIDLIDTEPARAAHILVCSIGFMLASRWILSIKSCS
jgi:hypothetical protein